MLIQTFSQRRKKDFANIQNHHFPIATTHFNSKTLFALMMYMNLVLSIAQIRAPSDMTLNPIAPSAPLEKDII